METQISTYIKRDDGIGSWKYQWYDLKSVIGLPPYASNWRNDCLKLLAPESKLKTHDTFPFPIYPLSLTTIINVKLIHDNSYTFCILYFLNGKNGKSQKQQWLQPTTDPEYTMLFWQ